MRQPRKKKKKKKSPTWTYQVAILSISQAAAPSDILRDQQVVFSCSRVSGDSRSFILEPHALLCSGVCQLFPISQATRKMDPNCSKDAPEAAKVTAEDLECGEMERTVSLSQIGFLIRSHVSSNDHSLSLQIKTTPRSKGQKYLNTKQPQNPTCFNEVSIGVLKDVKSIQKTNMRLLRKAQSLMLLFYTAAVKLSLGPIQPKSVGPVNRRKAPTPQKDNKKLLFFQWSSLTPSLT